MAINRRYGKGDLCGVSIGKEAMFGVSPEASGMNHAGVVKTYDPGIDYEYDEVVDCGKRTRGKQYISKKDVSPSVSFRLGKDVSLMSWFEFVLGKAASTVDLYQAPDSHTVHLKIGSGDYDTLVGCNVDKLTITSEDLGKAILVTADLFAKNVLVNDEQYANYGKQISQQTPMRAFNKWVCTDASIGTINSGKWTLTIAQNLQKVAGSDGEITLGSGESPYLGVPEVTLEITIPASSRKWDLLREEGKDGLRFSMVLGDVTITLTDCMVGGRGPSRSEDPYDETITLEVTNITVTSNATPRSVDGDA